MRRLSFMCWTPHAPSGVVGSLMNREQKAVFVQGVREDYDRVRQAHQDREAKPVLPLAEARARR